MKILVLGGTGAMGSHLVNLLANQGYSVSVTSRSMKKSTEKIHYIQGNAHDLQFISSLLHAKWDAIIDFMVYNTDEFRKRVSLYLKNTEQYVFLSSARVYANSEIPLTENSPRLLDVCKDTVYLQSDEYALTKARQEDILFGNQLQNWTIIRPYITYSENRLQLGVMEKEAWLSRVYRGKKILFSEDIASKMTTLTYGHDVARGIIALIGNHAALGEVFHITQPQACLWNDVFKLYLDTFESKTGSRPEFLLSQEAHRLNTTGKYQVLYDRHYNRIFDSSKIAEFIDINSFLPPLDGIRFCLEKFLENPSFLPLNWNEEAQIDRITHDFSLPENNIDKLKYCLWRYFPRLGDFILEYKTLLRG